MDELLRRIDRLAETALVEQRTVKDWYTTAEVARLLGKAEFTVREFGRAASKRTSVRAAAVAHGSGSSRTKS
jgi:predicted transcriptional regulator